MTIEEYKCIEYKNLISAIIRYDPNIGSFAIWSKQSFAHRQVYKSKMACFCSSDISYELPSEVISNRLFVNKDKVPSTKTNLWVSSYCKTPRDLFRNSGYKLVRDRNNADALITSAPAYDYPTLEATIVALDPDLDTLYLFRVSSTVGAIRDKYNRRLKDDVWDGVTRYLRERQGLIILHDNLKDEITVEFLPKIDDWKDILINNNPNYISEFSVQINYPVTISVESLQVWEHISDAALLAKTISMSDWKDYPITMLYFLMNKCPYDIKYRGGSSMELMTRQLQYDPYARLGMLLEGRIISPKDWNMLQDYIAADLNISDTGGFIAPSKLDSLNEYSSLIRKKVAVKPLKITQPMSYDDIKSFLYD